MLKPVKGGPFNVIIRALSERRVFRFDKTDPDDLAVLEQLEPVIKTCAEFVLKTPICRPRPNEVGNDMEAYVLRALRHHGFKCASPTSSNGRAKTTGYPDLLFYAQKGRLIYLECKIYAEGVAPTTMRSFYLSPSESFKVSLDAHHLLLAFGVKSELIAGSKISKYTPTDYKLIDLHDLKCDVKYEFNSDNKRLYTGNLVLLSGSV